MLAPDVPEPGVRGFLLQNLRPGAEPSWRIALSEIAAALPGIEGWDAPDVSYPGPVLVVRGERSDFVTPDNRAAFRKPFPAARFITLRNAGHWLHADVPAAFIQTVSAFLDA